MYRDDDVFVELVTEQQGALGTTRLVNELWMVFHGGDNLGPMPYTRAVEEAHAIAARDLVDVYRVRFPADPERIESYRPAGADAQRPTPDA